MPRILLEGLPCASSRATAPGSKAATSTNKQTFVASHSRLTINLSVLLAFCCHCCCVDSESMLSRFSIDVESIFNRFFVTVMLTVHRCNHGVHKGLVFTRNTSCSTAVKMHKKSSKCHGITISSQGQTNCCIHRFCITFCIDHFASSFSSII